MSDQAPTPKSWIHPLDVVRYHHASRMIGPEVAGAMLVMILRLKLNDKPDQWPPPEDLSEKVNDWLRDKGLMES